MLGCESVSFSGGGSYRPVLIDCYDSLAGAVPGPLAGLGVLVVVAAFLGWAWVWPWMRAQNIEQAAETDRLGPPAAVRLTPEAKGPRG